MFYTKRGRNSGAYNIDKDGGIKPGELAKTRRQIDAYIKTKLGPSPFSPNRRKLRGAPPQV